jgi:hypothetical protein
VHGDGSALRGLFDNEHRRTPDPASVQSTIPGGPRDVRSGGFQQRQRIGREHVAKRLGAVQQVPVPMAALMGALRGMGSLVSNMPASLITMHRGARRTIVAGAMWCALARQSYLAAVVPIAYPVRAADAAHSAARRTRHG